MRRAALLLATIILLSYAIPAPASPRGAPLRIKRPDIVPRLGAAAYLVKNIAERGGSSPTQFTKVGDRLFFVAGDNRHGRELWRTDGTTAGTVLVRDIRKGPFDSDPGRLVAVGDLLFFRAQTKRHGFELWRSDGSGGGTVLVKDINPGPRGSMYNSIGAFGQMEALGNTLFFRANDGETGNEMWTSDGTAAGTRLVKDIWPGHHESFPMMLTAFGDEVFFDAEDNEHGEELWKTDGSTDGTVLVKDINPGPDRSTPLQFTPVGNTLYFSANDGVHGFELWTTDGSDAGTQLVLDIYPGKKWSMVSEDPLVALGQRLFFPATDGQRGEELWTSDGTSGGTRIVADLVPGSGSLLPEELTPAEGAWVYFFGHGDKQLWKTDGTEGGTIPLIRLRTGVFLGSNWRQLFAIDSTVFFQNIDRDHGYELWRTDGTADGTGLAADINLGPGYSTPLPLNAIGTTLLIAAQDGVHGRELWALPTT